MHAMIVDLDPTRLERSQIAFLETGIHVTGSGSFAVAETCLRRAVVDVLVIDADCGAERIISLTALAERRNPRLVTILLARKVGEVIDLYSDAMSTLHCVLDARVSPRVVARMAQASLAGRATCKLTPAMADSVPQAPAQEPPAPRPVFSTTRRKPALPVDMAVPA